MRPFDIVTEDHEALVTLLREVDAAAFCFAPSGDQDRAALYVGGAERIARASVEARLGRVVYTSSTSALGSHDGWVDESFEEWPQSPRGRIQRQAELALAEGLRGTGVGWTILRLAGLYGPGRELTRIYHVADEERVRPGDGSEPTNLVHLDDASRSVLAALELRQEESGLIQVCDDDHRTRREVAGALARQNGFGEPKWEEPPRAEARGKRVSNERMKRLLRVDLRHPTHLA